MTEKTTPPPLFDTVDITGNEKEEDELFVSAHQVILIAPKCKI